ncbi:MAG: 2Fe-2S iron-sulfur cluster binding domain-containing protein [Deltaproteobacteria bacterium]|nr:2Fe-2S iron-sulfur cluster binding domain-containing protein [Deltaproteobacteria bacterium]
MPTVVFKRNRLMGQDLSCQAEVGESILDVAHRHGVPVGSNCGGVCGCSTCHVYVAAGFEDLEEMSDKECDRLDRAFDVRLNSRLGCQAEVGAGDLTIEITEESLKAYLDENPDIRRHLETTGEFLFLPRAH